MEGKRRESEEEGKGGEGRGEEGRGGRKERRERIG